MFEMRLDVRRRAAVHAAPEPTYSAEPRLGPRGHEQRAWAVGALSSAVMFAELAAGLHYNSMALIGDGLHTSTHVGVMTLAACAYVYARRHAAHPRFAFGTGKVGELAAFASGTGLAVFAFIIGLESLERLLRPEPVALRPAAIVASLSLVVGAISALLLREPRGEAAAGHGFTRGRDLNLWAAYLHMLADVITSILTIVALLAAAAFGWVWLDAAIGLVNAVVVAVFAARLLSRAFAMLLDVEPEDVARDVARRLANEPISHLRVWNIAPGRFVVAVRGAEARLSAVTEKLADMPGLALVLAEAGERSAT